MSLPVRHRYLTIFLSFYFCVTSIGGQIPGDSSSCIGMDRTRSPFQCGAISQNPEIMSITLGVISNYLTEWFRGVPRQERTARLKMVQETKEGSHKTLDYDGPVENLGSIQDVMDRFYDEH